jgi:hypothetical protein
MRVRLAALALASALVIFSAAQKRKPAESPGLTPPDTSVSFRVTFGYLRIAPKSYDGSLSVSGGKPVKVEPWRFFQQDTMTGEASWKLDIKRVVFENQPDKPNPVANGSAPSLNLVPAGVVVTVPSSSPPVAFRTRQGNFSVPVNSLRYGKALTFLEGDVQVERVPTAFRGSPETTEQQDYPSLLVTREGAVWTAWQAYQDRGDHVYALLAGGAPTRLTEDKGDVYGTAAGEDAQGKIHVVWSERRGVDWNLYERVYDGSRWGERRQITTTHSPNIFHKLVSSADALRLVWVGYEGGQSYLYLAAWRGGDWSEPQRIGGPGVWSPDAAADRQGNLYVAWDGYQNGNYDIFLRRIPASGAPEAIEQVTTSPRFQAHASVAVDGQARPWLAWDESGVNWGKDWNHEDPNRATVLYADRSIRVVMKDAGEWKEAGDFSAAVPERLRRYWQLPHLAADGAGRIWAVFQMRTSALNNRDDFWCNGGLWDLYLTTYENGAWRPAAFVPHSTSRNEAPFRVAGAADRIHMTWAGDGMEFGHVPPGYQGATMAHYEIFGAQASQPGPPGGGADPAAMRPFTDAASRPQIMHPREKEDVARVRSYRATVNGTTYRILRGDFHRHTDISADGSGDGSLEDYYRYMLDVAEMDTGIVSDHNMGGDVEYNWWRTEKSYDVFHIRGRYTPLFGYERSVNYPNGHRNVVFDHRGVRTLPVGEAENRADVNSGGIVYPYLRQNRGICMEHSLATGQGTDYRDNDPTLEPLVEIYQGYHSSYEYKGAPRAENDSNFVLIHGSYEPAGFWWNALAKGLKLGVQASSDHISTHCSYALIYTPDEDRGRIVDNMRRRHAYAATDNIILDFQAEEPDGTRHLMGEAFAASSEVKLRARIIGTDQLSQVDLIRNNEFLYTRSAGGKELDFEYADQAPRPGENYYYLRVIQQDHNLAWSSPIWVTR